MAIFNKDMVQTTTTNDFYQKEVYLDDACQIVMMNIEAGDEIGEETHEAGRRRSSSPVKAKPSSTATGPRSQATT